MTLLLAVVAPELAPCIDGGGYVGTGIDGLLAPPLGRYVEVLLVVLVVVGADVVPVLDRLFLSNGLTRSCGWANVEDGITVLLVILLPSALVEWSSVGCLPLSAAEYEPKSALELPALVRSIDDCDDGMKFVVVVDVVVGTDGATADADGATVEPPSVRPRFLLANSYMSPNMPANVLRRFFIVSSASSATDVCDCVGCRCGVCCAPVAACREADEIVDDCEACESRRPTPDIAGLRCCWSSCSLPPPAVISDVTLLRLPCRPIEPGPGVLRSGIGGGAPLALALLVDTGRGRAGSAGGSSVGLPPRDDSSDVRDVALERPACPAAGAAVVPEAICDGRQTACIFAVTRSAIWRRSSSWLSPISCSVLSLAPRMCSRASLPTATEMPQTSMPPNSSETCQRRLRC